MTADGIMLPLDLHLGAQAKYASGAGAQAESLLLSVLRGWGLEQQQEPQGASLGGSQLVLRGGVACFFVGDGCAVVAGHCEMQVAVTPVLFLDDWQSLVAVSHEIKPEGGAVESNVCH